MYGSVCIRLTILKHSSDDQYSSREASVPAMLRVSVTSVDPKASANWPTNSSERAGDRLKTYQVEERRKSLWTRQTPEKHAEKARMMNVMSTPVNGASASHRSTQRNKARGISRVFIRRLPPVRPTNTTSSHQKCATKSRRADVRPETIS